MSTNPKSVSNVNQKQGPRTGNSGTPSKRGEFMDAKDERAKLAKPVQAAYGQRAPEDKVNKKLEGISSDTKAKFKR